jgi:hypothetical protein
VVAGGTVKINLKSKLNNLWWDIVNSRPVAALPWSTMRRIGHSRLLSLTIVVPFLGSLLLFNQHVVELLTLSPDLVRRWMNIPSAGAEDAARQITLSRLYYVYFGLTFLGVGSALFNLFCPLIVKSYASAIECLQVESTLTTRSRIALIVSDISYSYLDWLGGHLDEIPSTWKRMSEPLEFTNLCSVAILEIFSTLPPELLENEPVASSEEPQEDNSAVTVPPTTPVTEATSINEDDPFYDRRGRPDPYMIAKALISGSRHLQWFAQAFQKQAGSESHRNDMLTLHYIALDHTRPRLRLLVAFFYAAGFGLLAIPTIITFVQLTWHILR